MNRQFEKAYLQWKKDEQQLKERNARLLLTGEELHQHQKEIQRICEEYTAALNTPYISQLYGELLSRVVRHIFQNEIKETLRDLRSRNHWVCVQRFRQFLNDGAEAFVSDHRTSYDRWSMQVRTALLSVLKEEKLPAEFQKALMSRSACLDQLRKNMNIAMEIQYTRISRGYQIKELREQVAGFEKLKKALTQAEKTFDFTAKYAQRGLLDYLPDDYADLYPAARTTERHFVLHIGPTNSGKTYSALQAMHRAQDGIYLAPLRLLAYEQFDNMNRDGIYCSLRTGEERISVPGSTVQSCTIEMLDEHHLFDIVVIDEAQMVQDPMRGGHWTKAILGAWAKQIHVCLAPEAQNIIIRMIEQCHDTYEIIRHERFTQLEADQVGNVTFPRGVQEGDAYIVFNRASAHACAAQLQRHGINPSIIYGGLPYDVRQNEARRFREGETKVVVATDAIGMGLNLPIRRVVFLETQKFDGVKKRGLLASEYKQIAGRAGRYGQYERGLYVSPYQMRKAVKAMSEPIPPIEAAHVLFPDALLGIDAPLSSILHMWEAVPSNAGYLKGNVHREIQLATTLEHYSDDKDLIYSLISMPFDPERTSVLSLWKAMSLDVIQKKKVQIDPYMPDINALCQKPDLEKLENTYRLYDLIYYFAERFDKSMRQRIIDERKMVSALMMQILSSTRLAPKVCRMCHRSIPWNSPSSV